MRFNKAILEKFPLVLVSAPAKPGFKRAVIVQSKAHTFDESAVIAIKFSEQVKKKVVLYFNGVYLPIKAGTTAAEAWQEFLSIQKSQESAPRELAIRTRANEKLRKKQEKDAAQIMALQNSAPRKGKVFIEALKKAAKGKNYFYYAVRRLKHPAEITEFVEHYQAMHPKHFQDNLSFALEMDFIVAGTESFWKNALAGSKTRMID